MKTHKGILYFDSYKEARDYAWMNSYPKDRIINYKFGWAIQLYKSGPYVGSDYEQIKSACISYAD